jgi:hypothetical protein
MPAYFRGSTLGLWCCWIHDRQVASIESALLSAAYALPFRVLVLTLEARTAFAPLIGVCYGLSSQIRLYREEG